MNPCWTTPAQRVLVIDPRLLVRAGARSIVDGLPGFVCVGAAADAASGLRSCQELLPDLVILDLELPETAAPDDAPSGGAMPSGLHLALVLQRELPRTRVLALTSRLDAESLRAALRAGVVACLTPQLTLAQWTQALRSAVEGRRWLSPEASRALAEADRPAPRLTPRQRDVLRLLAAGRSNKQIARDLGVSVKTVEYHRAELIMRLDLHDVASLTRFALAQGLVD